MAETAAALMAEFIVMVDVDLAHDSFILVYIVGIVPVYTAQAGFTMMVLV